MTRNRVPLGNYVTEYSVRNKDNEDIPVYSVTNSQGFCREYFGKEVASKDKTTYKIVPYGYFAYNPSRINVGSVDWQRCEAQVIVSPLYNVFSVSDELDRQFLYYFLKSNIGRQMIRAKAAGSVRDNLKLDMLKEMTIPDSSLDDQRHCVATLDNLQYLIELRKKQLNELDDLVKARFVEVFGDPKSNPNSYPIGQLSEHIEFLTSGSRGWAQYCVDNGSEWFITIKNVKDCRISIDNMQPINAPDNAEAKRTKVQEGDLLISITADLGRTGVVTKEIADHGAYINQHLTCIRLNKEILNPLYVAFFMESPAGKEQFESKNQSAVKAGLNFNSINSLRLLVPPMDEQSAFVEFVHQVDKSKVVVQKALDEAQTLFDSLMQKYFG
ncbi:restriction endonuclease subunit S [Pseudoflavonifractor sp. HCP28S3_F10]|uniref:restriction endonuclease subunit S n=1 Tax=Pseudoflavonifractor sp. HCP28S3_F10 TaxID=3438947 RepID=UPI003F8AAD36